MNAGDAQGIVNETVEILESIQDRGAIYSHAQLQIILALSRWAIEDIAHKSKLKVYDEIPIAKDSDELDDILRYVDNPF